MEGNHVITWRKSSYSGNNGGDCVEVGAAVQVIAVRDTKQDSNGPVLLFSPAAWRSFADQVRLSLGSLEGPDRDGRAQVDDGGDGAVAAGAGVPFSGVAGGGVSRAGEERHGRVGVAGAGRPGGRAAG
jgi:hypothetical protein